MCIHSILLVDVVPYFVNSMSIAPETVMDSWVCLYNGVSVIVLNLSCIVCVLRKKIKKAKNCIAFYCES
jgi:hypothetical protein